MPVYERGAPLRTLLHWWLRRRGRHMIHAGAVGTAGAGALLAGKSGSGKSTTALACLFHGLRYAADDYCALAINGFARVYSAYSSAKLAPDHLLKFPQLQSAIGNPGDLEGEKALVFLQPRFPSQLARELPLKALLLPRLSGRPDTTLTPASPLVALRTLAPSSIFQMAGAGDAEFRLLGELVQRVDCYWLELGTDLARVTEVVGQALAGR